MGSDGKLPTSATAAKGPKGWAQRFLNVGFVAGFLLVLLTYAVVSQQSQRFGAIIASPDDVAAISKQAIKAPGETGLAQEDGGEEKTETTTPAEPSADHHQHQDTSGDSNQDDQQQPVAEQEWRPKAVVTEEPPKRDDTAAKPFDNGKVVLTTAGPYSDTCDVFGDVRTNGTAHTVTLVPATSFTERREWTIKPYIRRTMSGIPEMEQVNNTKFYRLGNGGSLIFERDLDALSEYLERPHPEFFETQVNDQPGGELQWVVVADLRGKMEPPMSERIQFSIRENNWLDGLAHALQEALARLCGQNVTQIQGTRFAHLARHDSIGGPMALSS